MKKAKATLVATLPASFLTAAKALTTDPGFLFLAARMDVRRTGCGCATPVADPLDNILEITAGKKSSDPAAKQIANWFGHMMQGCCGAITPPIQFDTELVAQAKAKSADPAVAFIAACLSYFEANCCPAAT